MRAVLRFIKFNFKAYILTSLTFLAFWHSYTAIQEYRDTYKVAFNVSEINSDELQKAIVEQDLVGLKKYLWKIKSNNIKTIELEADEGIAFLHSNVLIGELKTYSIFNRVKAKQLKVNGLQIGNLSIYVDIWDLQKNVLLANAEVMVIVSLFFILLLVIANIRTSRSLAGLEKKISKINNSSTNQLEEVIQDLLSKSHLKNHEFYDFLRKYASVLKENAHLDNEIEKIGYRQKVMDEVAHGIKSPVHTLNVLKNNLPDNLEEGQKQLFQLACQRINQLANGILGSKSLEETESEITKTEINQAIRKLINLKAAEYSKYKNIDLKFLPSAKPIYAEVSVPGLYEVLSNLINNAFEAIDDEKGTIEIKTASKAGKIIISCSDNGKGIPSEIIDEIWSDSFSYNKRHGSGLGLPVVKKIIEEKWGGKIDVSSKLGLGTTFNFSIPSGLK